MTSLNVLERNNTCVVIATYNEAETIGGLLEKLKAYDVIVVDDNSPDGTAAIARQARRPNHFVIQRDERGVTSAYLRGLDLARYTGYEFIIQMDAGGTHKASDVAALVQKLGSNGLDLVIGARRWKWKGLRTLISQAAVFAMGMLGVVFSDVTSGFRCWRGDFLRKMNFSDVTSKGFAFQLEMLHQASMRGAKIDEYPIEYKLTNSSFRWWMLKEAVGVWFRIAILQR